MAQGFVGRGGPGQMTVTGPGFSRGPGITIGNGADYSGQMNKLLQAEQDYLPRLQKWAQSQREPVKPNVTEMNNLRTQMMMAQGGGGGGGGRYSAPAPARVSRAAPASQEPQLRQFTSYIPGGPGYTGGKQSYWAFGPKGPNDFASGLTLPASAMGPASTQVLQGPGVSGAGLHTITSHEENEARQRAGAAGVPYQGIGSGAAGADPQAATNDWQANPGVRNRMLGQMYDKQYYGDKGPPKGATANDNWSKAYFGG